MRSLREAQSEFFRALDREEPKAEGLRGRFEIYQYAYFERIRGSIAEDFPELFEYLEAVTGLPAGVDSEGLTRDLLNWNHPGSWTLAEASIPIRESVLRLLDAPRFAAVREECFRRIALDEAGGLASWLEEWPDPAGNRTVHAGEFAADRLRLARTQTWRQAGERVFWRSERGVRTVALEDFQSFLPLFPFVETPILFSAFAERAGSVVDPAVLTAFLQRGVAEGWLRLTP
jgi:hypothetical protein